MGWQADHHSRPGKTPDWEQGLPDLLAGFGDGGPWATAVPSAALAMVLETAAGPDGLYDGADTDALVGIARQWAAVESWAAAGLLGALRAMVREDQEGTAMLRRRTDLPDGWDDSLTYEIAAALAMGPVSAGNLAALACTLGTRLPGTGRLLADGTLTRAKAKLVAQVFGLLTEDEAARAEALIIGELDGKTYPQVEKLAWRAALAVAPDIAERRRSKAERDHTRVTVFREESGAVGLSGRDLPAAEALSGHANVVDRARQYEASGAFPGHSTSRLQALAYLDLLNGVSAADRIAFARTPAGPPDRPEPDSGTPQPGDDTDPTDGPGDEAPGMAGSGAGDPADRESHDGNQNPGGSRGGEGSDGGADPDGSSGPDGGPGPDGGGNGSDGPRGAPGQPALPEVIIPLATLLRRAERPGDNRLLGPLDPAMIRDLAAAAARSPASRWEVTIVDEHGYAIGHGTGRPGRGSRQQQQTGPRLTAPRLTALHAQMNITVTETLLHQLATQAAEPRSGAPPGDWALTRKTTTDGYGTWTLTLLGGRELTVRFDVVPTHACDHRHAVSAYQPGNRLRRLVQVRDYECTFPTCSRPARESDFEHAVPYDQGGATDACNAGARSRRCHQVKQMPHWSVTQPKPGWHVWTTPTGRTYVQEPWRYPA